MQQPMQQPVANLNPPAASFTGSSSSAVSSSAVTVALADDFQPVPVPVTVAAANERAATGPHQNQFRLRLYSPGRQAALCLRLQLPHRWFELE